MHMWGMIKLGDLVQHIDDLSCKTKDTNHGIVIGFGYSGDSAYQQQTSETYVQVVFNDNCSVVECWPRNEIKVLSSARR